MAGVANCHGLPPGRLIPRPEGLDQRTLSRAGQVPLLACRQRRFSMGYERAAHLPSETGPWPSGSDAFEVGEALFGFEGVANGEAERGAGFTGASSRGRLGFDDGTGHAGEGAGGCC